MKFPMRRQTTLFYAEFYADHMGSRLDIGREKLQAGV